jgi:acylphosphatase
MESNVHVIISGRVQGVWFRVSVKQKAEKLGITGWVRNLSDGTVEAVFQGEDNSIKEILEWCNHGPPFAKVDRVMKNYQDPIKSFDNFFIRY